MQLNRTVTFQIDINNLESGVELFQISSRILRVKCVKDYTILKDYLFNWTRSYNDLTDEQYKDNYKDQLKGKAYKLIIDIAANKLEEIRIKVVENRAVLAEVLDYQILKQAMVKSENYVQNYQKLKENEYFLVLKRQMDHYGKMERDQCLSTNSKLYLHFWLAGIRDSTDQTAIQNNLSNKSNKDKNKEPNIQESVIESDIQIKNPIEDEDLSYDSDDGSQYNKNKIRQDKEGNFIVLNKSINIKEDSDIWHEFNESNDNYAEIPINSERQPMNHQDVEFLTEILQIVKDEKTPINNGDNLCTDTNNDSNQYVKSHRNSVKKCEKMVSPKMSPVVLLSPKKIQQSRPGTSRNKTQMEEVEFGEIKDPDSGVVLYRGQIRNCMRHGKGKSFQLEGGWNDYEGEYHMDKRDGKGKMMNKEGLVIYEGNFKEGMMNGKGVWRGEEGFTYCGEMQKDKPNGKGIKLGREYKIYDGIFVDGLYDGYGVLYKDGKMIYEGGFKEALRCGIGKEFDQKDGILLHEGFYDDDSRHGEGKEYDRKGDIVYQGDYYRSYRSGIGKEYNHFGKIIYDGEFKDGYRIGKGYGYLYDPRTGIIIYEGNLLNEKKNGKGKEFDRNGNQIYEGEFTDGVRQGNGKQFDGYGNLIYDGCFRNGVRCGKGKEFSTSGEIIFSGDWKRGSKKFKAEMAQDIQQLESYQDGELVNDEGCVIYKGGQKSCYPNKYLGIENVVNENGDNDIMKLLKEGWGKEFDNDGNIIYDGEFVNDLKEGEGIQQLPVDIKVFEGVYVKGSYDHGTIFDDQGNMIYEGKFTWDEENKSSKYDGQGTEYYSNGRKKYKGNYNTGNFDGHGVFFDEKGTRRYEGEFKKGFYNGEGSLYDKDGFKKYKGGFLNSKFEGIGELYDIDDVMLFRGDFKANYITGFGCAYDFETTRYEGEWFENKCHGKGILYDEFGNVIHNGQFNENKLIYGCMSKFWECCFGNEGKNVSDFYHMIDHDGFNSTRISGKSRMKGNKIVPKGMSVKHNGNQNSNYKVRQVTHNYHGS